MIRMAAVLASGNKNAKWTAPAKGMLLFLFIAAYWGAVLRQVNLPLIRIQK